MDLAACEAKLAQLESETIALRQQQRAVRKQRLAIAEEHSKLIAMRRVMKMPKDEVRALMQAIEVAGIASDEGVGTPGAPQ